VFGVVFPLGQGAGRWLASAGGRHRCQAGRNRATARCRPARDRTRTGDHARPTRSFPAAARRNDRADHGPGWRVTDHDGGRVSGGHYQDRPVLSGRSTVTRPPRPTGPGHHRTAELHREGLGHADHPSREQESSLTILTDKELTGLRAVPPRSSHGYAEALTDYPGDSRCRWEELWEEEEARGADPARDRSLRCGFFLDRGSAPTGIAATTQRKAPGQEHHR